MTLDDLAKNFEAALDLPAEEKAAAADMGRRARRMVPVDKGNLRATIKEQVTGRGIVLEAGSRQVHYAEWNEKRHHYMERAATEGAEAMASRIGEHIGDEVTRG